uniref:SMI1/KNR4 family protein n=1 Tax=Thaumasiovibrio occultus TaxID=1891184 RepID=UPI00131DE999|nr:SMI1/KNR4 family protein [Thaumasiovibrio occultus]
MDIVEAVALLIEKQETVPRPLRLPTEEEVAAAERQLNFPFPSQYRYFMLHASHVCYGVLEPALVLPDLAPYLDLIALAKRGWEQGVSNDHLAFCGDNGNFFTINQSGEVGYFDHHEADVELGGGDFKDWILEDWLELD